MQQNCRVGTTLYAVVGPMGIPSHIGGKKKVVCVGGGLGVAPIFPQARAWKESGAYVIGILGFRNRGLVFWEDKFRACCDELILCTDDGSAGIKGLVTEGIKQAIAKHADIEELVAIGPPVMMKGCAEATRPHKIPHDGEPEPGHGRRHRDVRRLPREDRRDGEVRLRRRPGLRRPPGRLRRPHVAAGPLQGRGEGGAGALPGELPASAGDEARPSPWPPSTTARPRTADTRNTEAMAKKKTIRTIPQERTPVQEQDPKERARNFEEVSLGYRLEEALVEAERCLQCADEPCVRGCPVGIDIPGFIQKLTEKHYHGAYDIITDTNLLPSICGRVCPQESQCEGVCTVGDTLEPVAIGRLERFVGDMAIKEGWANIPYIEPNGYRVGIVGAGPAGMACAADMAKAGCEVVVYEAFHQPGGVLKYGIPDFRLPNDVIDAEIDKLRKLGIRFECNTLVGRLFTIEQMVTEMGFHAVFIGHGRRLPELHGHPGRVA